MAEFREELGETGWVEGQNLAIEYRWAEFRYHRLPALAADLVGRKVDLIAACGGAGGALAAQSATSTIPTVFTVGADPVDTGLVASLARPGGNLIGFSIVATELDPKRLDLLSELVPTAPVMGLLVNPNRPDAERSIADVSGAARIEGVQLQIRRASVEGDFESVYASLVELQVRALVIAADPLFGSRRQELWRRAIRFQQSRSGVNSLRSVD